MENVDIDKKNDVDFHYKRAMQKAKNNLVWFGIFSIVMLFSGLTSGYLVSSGDGFWVNFGMPKAFYTSTILILISSVTMFLAVRFAKKQERSKAITFIGISIVLGLVFGFFQFQGWAEINERGLVFSDKIYNTQEEKFNIKGEYGVDFSIDFQGNRLMQEEDGFHFWGEDAIKIDEAEYKELKSTKPKMAYGKDFVRVQKAREKNKKTKKRENIFQVVVLTKKKLSENYLAKLKDNGNTSSSYFYLITIVHLAHFLFAIAYLFYLLITLLIGKNNEIYYQRIKRTGNFWHFFGGLWIYLLIFLFFIH